MTDTKTLLKARLQELIATREMIHAELEPVRQQINRFTEDVAAINILIDEQALIIKAKSKRLFDLEKEISEVARVTGGKFISDNEEE